MDLKDLSNYINGLPAGIKPEALDIAVETATEYYKKSFARKAFDGNPWEPGRSIKMRGSLLIDSGALLNSIRPSFIGVDRAEISAGNNKVTYAKAHNEGYRGDVSISAHTRSTKYGGVSVRAHTREVDIPQRQFMGDAKDLENEIHNKIERYIKSALK